MSKEMQSIWIRLVPYWNVNLEVEAADKLTDFD